MTTATRPPRTATAKLPASRHVAAGVGEPGARLSQTLVVPFRLPGLNDIIGQMSGHLTMRGRRVYRYTQTKRNMTRTLVGLIRTQRLDPVAGRVWVMCEWSEAGKRRDPDNIAAGGCKLILDALKAAGIIANDGWRNIAGFEHQFVIGKPGVTVQLVESAEHETADDIRARAREAERVLAEAYTPPTGDGITPGKYKPTDGVNNGRDRG